MSSTAGRPGESPASRSSVFRKLQEQKGDIELELEKIFSASVTAAVQEPPADSAAPERVATIVLGVLLACTLVAFLVYVVLTVKRKRYPQLLLYSKYKYCTFPFRNYRKAKPREE